jgi:hypothetical protein
MIGLNIGGETVQAFLVFPSQPKQDFQSISRHQDIVIWVGYQWLMPVILAACEAEIERVTVQDQPWKIFCETPISKVTRAEQNGLEMWFMQ